MHLFILVPNTYNCVTYYIIMNLMYTQYNTAHYANLLSYGRREGKNSIKPFFAMMLGVGCIGYTMEYIAVYHNLSLNTRNYFI